MLLSEEVQVQLKEQFKNLDQAVKLVVFTQELECEYCRETRQMAEEVASLSDKLSLEVYNFAIDKDKAEAYGVDKIPALVVEGDRDYGIRFFGIPGGYEFSSLVETIKMVSARDSGLSQKSREALSQLKKPVHIQVFVTLTCPYCPLAVKVAHQMALESPSIRADMVEAAEFPHLANKYRVFAVPKIVINEKVQVEGALPEAAFVAQVVGAAT